MELFNKYHKILYVVCGILFVALLISSIVMVNRINSGEIKVIKDAALSAPVPTPEVTPEPTPVPTPQPTPVPTPVITPVPTPIVTPEPIMATPEELESVPVAVMSEIEELKEPGTKLRIFVQYNNNYNARYYDGNDATYDSVFPGSELKVTAGEGIGMLYIKWGRAPGPWTLVAGDQEIECGQYGYQHELVRISEPSDTLYIKLNSEHDHTIAEIEAYTQGSLPENVQDWQPACEQADILIFPTHSDDEFLYMGGLIPKYVSEGKTIQVAYLVDHRYNERLDSLWEAGVRNYPVTSAWGDFYCETVKQAYNTYNYKEIVNYIVEQIRRFKPLVVVGQAENGEDGHAVRIMYVDALKEAIAQTADPEFKPSSAQIYGTWDVPKTYLHLFGSNRVTLNYEIPLPDFGGRTAFDVAKDAFNRCVTQAVSKHYVYGYDSEYDSHQFGLYRSSVGEDEALNDLFENIPFSYRDENK